MRKFINLVKNEYIKSLSRLSTIIMLLLLVVATVGYVLFVKVQAEAKNQYMDYDSHDMSEHYQFRADELKVSTSVLDRFSRDKYQLMADIAMDGDDWREEKIDTLYDTIKDSVDLSAYNELIAEITAQVDAQYADKKDYDYFEYENTINAEIDKRAEELNKLRDEAYMKVYNDFYASEENKKLIEIFKKNDYIAYYNFMLDKSKKELASGKTTQKKYEANEWFYTTLIDGNIKPVSDSKIYRYMKYDLYIGSSDSSKYLNTYKLYNAKMIIAKFENNEVVNNIEYNEAVESLILYQYMVDNDISYNIAEHETTAISTLSDSHDDYIHRDFWSAMCESQSLVMLIAFICVILAATSVAAEYSNGTIKFLLINPRTRSKIIFSKYAFVLSAAFVMMVIVFIVSFITSLCCFGGSELGAGHYQVVGGEVVSTNGILYVAKEYLLTSISVLAIATIAFTISTLMKSSALAIGASIIMLISGTTVVLSLKEGFGYDWSRYLLFANINIKPIIQGTSGYANITVGFSVLNLIIHLAVLLLIAHDAFTKREV